MASSGGKAPASRLGMLRVIALYKLIKVLLLLLIAYGVIRLHDASLVSKISNWASARPMGMERQVVTWVLEWFSGLSEARVQTYRLLVFAYAAVFAVEGVGLWMRQRWAEWLTAILTASLIPLEIWELLHKPTFGVAAVLVANAAIVAYLIWQLRKTRKH